jgi:hypothetical protein
MKFMCIGNCAAWTIEYSAYFFHYHIIQLMKNPVEIRKLVMQRLHEAEILFSHGKSDGAFYLAGYAAELSLKAKICERLGIPNLLDDSFSDPGETKGIHEIRRSIRTHNLLTLLILGGLKSRFDSEKATNVTLSTASSLLLSAWDEKARYKPCGHFQERDVARIIELLSDANGLLKWIERH